MTIPTPRQLLTLCFLACTLSAPAQTLARPGWVGSGMSADLWWKHAILYQIDPANFSPSATASPLQGITQRLDYIHSLGVDALLLTPIQPGPTHAQAIDTSLGTFDDLDDLIHEASRRNIRVLLDLPPGIASADLPNVARLWLNRGIAGFHLSGTSSLAASEVAALRTVTNSFLGQRIVIGDLGSSLPSSLPNNPEDQSQLPHSRIRSQFRPSDAQLPQLTLDPRPGTSPQLTASSIRPAIDAAQDILQSGGTLPLLASDGPSLQRSMSRYADGRHDLAIAKIVATILLTTRADTLLFYGQELGLTSPASSVLKESPTPRIAWNETPHTTQGKASFIVAPEAQTGLTPSVAAQDADQTSLLSWYRQLTALRHGNLAVNNGSNVTLNHDDQNVVVWVRKPQTVSLITPAVVVICNTSSQSVQLNLKPDIERLNLRGSFLRTLLRTDNGRGPMDLQSIALPPYAVYIGQIRY